MTAFGAVQIAGTMDTLLQDIRSGIRQLSRQRGSSAVAVVTLALGIGVSTALLSLIDATLLRPLPYPDPTQLVTVYVEVVQPDGTTQRPSASMADMRAWQAADDVFTMVAGAGQAFRGRIADGAEPQRIAVAYFTEDYLALHGAAPVIGRDFTRADTEPGTPLVALLGHSYWRSRYAGRTDVIGETIRLDDDIAIIVGVLPAWFQTDVPLATPLRIAPANFSRRGMGSAGPHVYARLRPDVTLDQARERLAARTAASGAGPGRAEVVSLFQSTTSRYRTTVGVLTGAVGLILLIACVNVAGLLLARGAARQGELSVRASLGASRARLMRQLLTESVMLALLGGALGVVLAWLSLDALIANVPLTLPPNTTVTVNPVVLACTIALLVPASLLFGLVPALRLSQIRLGPMLSRAGRQSGATLSRRGGQALIAAEVALAVVLVAGAGLMIRSFLRISDVDLGFNPDGLVTMEVLPLERSPDGRQAYYAALVQQLRTIPGVSSAGLVDNFTLGDGTTYSSVVAGGKPVRTTVFEVLPGYLETIGARLRSGRLPTDADGAVRNRGVVINESLARTLFPDGPAVGGTFTRRGGEGRAWTVVGVIADLRHRGPLDPRSVNEPQVFYPFEATEYNAIEAMTIVVRPSVPDSRLAERLRERAIAVNPRVIVERIRIGHDWFSERVITPRRRMVLLGLLGGLGLVLALVGVFGMTHYAVTRRTPEIGVRMAFGARPAQVVRTIVRDAAVPIMIGTVAGVGAATFATRAIESFLFGTAPGDPLTLAVVAATLAIAGSLAALGPAMRAITIDPVACLRAE